MKNLSLFAGFLFTMLCANVLLAQTNRVEFGKNKVQYHKNTQDWNLYNSDHFTTYWYGESRNVGMAAVHIAELDFAELQRLLEFRINTKLELIVYTDLNDLSQSNIGTEDVFISKEGESAVFGNKIFVYFDGNHQHLRNQIREGIASVLLNYIFYGNSLQEILQNSVNSTLPLWFLNGIVKYAAVKWDNEADAQLRDLFSDPKWLNFNRLSNEKPQLAGQALWFYIESQYGENNVSNLIYLARVNRNVESDFSYVLGSSFEKVSADALQWYKKRYDSESANLQNITNFKYKKPRKKGRIPISNISFAPNGRDYLYAINDIGRFSVFLVKDGKTKRLKRAGIRNDFQKQDPKVPLLAWNSDGTAFSILFSKKDVYQLWQYDTKSKKMDKSVLTGDYQYVYSMQYLRPDELLLSANIRGFSDLVRYNTTLRNTSRLTNDIYDDLSATPFRIYGRVGYLFVSNRQSEAINAYQKIDSILPLAPMDLYAWFPLEAVQPLIQLSHDFATEEHPQQINDSLFIYTSDVSGIRNTYIATLDSFVAFYEKHIYLSDKSYHKIPADSVLTFADTITIDSEFVFPVWHLRMRSHAIQNLERPVKHVSATKGDSLCFVVNYNQKDRIIRTPISDSTQIFETTITTSSNPAQEQAKTGIQDDTTAKDYDFIAPFPDIIIPTVVTPQISTQLKQINLEQPIISPYRIRGLGIIAYRPAFRTNFVKTNFDNGPLFGGFQTFQGQPENFRNNNGGILARAQFEELLENYLLEAGFRLFTTFQGSEAYVLFEDRLHRWDKRYGVYRRGNITRSGDNIPINKQRNSTFMCFGEWRYPFDTYQRIAIQGSVRQDRTVALGTDTISLRKQDLVEQRLGARLEYVYDNTKMIQTNLPQGIRAKVWAETFYRFDLQANTTSDTPKGFMNIIGFDARYYTKLTHKSIFALRLAGASSRGAERMLYLLGGADNPLTGSFDPRQPLPGDPRFAYQAPVTSVRGHMLNVKNGSSYAVINTELRFPVVQMLSQRRVKSTFWRNLQLVGFFDAGSAWLGATPFSLDNPANTIILPENASPNNPVTVEVTYFRNPLVMGTGAGLRASLLGYYLRIDRAYGIDNTQLLKPIWHLSLGTDF